MKITKDYTRKDGVRTITVQLAKGEKLMEFKDDSYYRLGGQIDDVVAVHCIIEGKRTADPTTIHTCTPPQENT